MLIAKKDYLNLYLSVFSSIYEIIFNNMHQLEMNYFRATYTFHSNKFQKHNKTGSL